MKTNMKYRKTIAFAVLMMFGAGLMAQEKTDTVKQVKSDSIKFSWGNSKVIIVGGDNEEDSKEDDSKKQRYNHFAGIDIGVNGFLNPDMGTNLQKEAEFMDLNYGKSIAVSLNFWEKYIPIAKEKFGIMTGLGFEFNNYDLDRDVTIFTDKDTTFGVDIASKSIEKNKFKSTMLNWPVMLETNIGKDARHSFHLAAGVMLSYRVGSKTKQIYEEGGKEFKVKNRNDFNMNPFRANLTARVGYGQFTMFASYSLTEMFEDNDGPEIYPFTVGISLAAF